MVWDGRLRPMSSKRNSFSNRLRSIDSDALWFGLPAIGGVAILLAAGAVALTAISTASASFAGSTSSEDSLFEAAAVDLSVTDGDGSSSRLAIEAEGLYPGLVIQRCLIVGYRGSLDDVPIRLHGESGDSSGLEQYLRTTIQAGSGSSPACDDFKPEQGVFSGTLAEFWQDHATFASGVELMSSASDGDTITVRFATEIDDDDQAQGLITTFAIVFEARP